MLCLDEEDRYVEGNFHSDVASIIRVRLNRCTGEDYCKSREEIEAYMSDKYVLLYMNKVRFQANAFFDESVIRES